MKGVVVGAYLELAGGPDMAEQDVSDCLCCGEKFKTSDQMVVVSHGYFGKGIKAPFELMPMACANVYDDLYRDHLLGGMHVKCFQKLLKKCIKNSYVR